MEHSKKSLTIHLYSVREALASIRWAILSRNHTEAIFWGLELYDSNMEHDAIRALALTWSSRIGFGSICALESLRRLDTADRDTWCQTLMAWCRIRIHDTTVFHLLLRGSKNTYQPEFPHSKNYPTLDSALEDTLNRRKLLDAWYICRAMTPSSQWNVLQKLAFQKGLQSHYTTIEGSPLSDLEKRAAICTLLTLTSDALNSAALPLSYRLPDELIDAIVSWDSEDSLRKRRIYKVKPEAITYLCDRSSQPVTESNESDIQDDLEKTLVSSPYWQGVLKAHVKPRMDAKTIELEREKFYDIFFACDIPDEWSIADREKSHGRGLGKLDDQAIKQYIDTTVHGSITLGLWNSMAPRDVPSLDWDTLYSATYTLSMSMTPTKKEFAIVAS